MPSAPRSKNWCFTINNYTPLDTTQCAALEHHCDYVVYGKEKGEDGTPHYQGFCVFKVAKRLSAVKSLLPRAHLEIKVRKSKYSQASDYCKKDGDFTEIGTCPLDHDYSNRSKEANKRKWDDAFELAKQGNFEEIEKDMLIRYYHAFKRVRQDYPDTVQNLEDVCGVWIHGVPGVGKSHKARQAYAGTLYDKPLNKWWDGYQGEDNVLLDDIGTKEAEWMGTFLKRWADRYSFPAEQKGTTVQIRPNKIIVTSNYSIDDLFASDFSLCEALKRRFQQEHQTERWTTPEAEIAEGLVILSQEPVIAAILHEVSMECSSTEEISITPSIDESS